MLDSDEIRELLGARSYEREDRDRFYEALGSLAGLIANQGIVVLVAATAPRRAHRERARAALGAGGRFVEVWVKTPLSVCEARDPKGLYARARRGGANQLPGVGVAYEPPVAPEVVADGGLDDSVAEAIERQLERPQTWDAGRE